MYTATLFSLFTDSYTIYKPGEFNYTCSGDAGGQGKFSVVRGHYGIVLCRDCSATDHMVLLGTVLYWSYGEENMMCSPMVQSPGSKQPTEIDGEKRLDSVSEAVVQTI